MHHGWQKHHSISQLCKNVTFLTFTTSEDVQKHIFCIDNRIETFQNMCSERTSNTAHVQLIQNMACTYCIHTGKRHRAVPPWGTYMIPIMNVNPKVNGINWYDSSSTKKWRSDSGVFQQSFTPFVNESCACAFRHVEKYMSMRLVVHQAVLT